MIHSASRGTVDGARQQLCLLLQLRVHLVEDRLRLARVAAGREHEEVRVDAHGSHVEDDDVFCQLLARESGDPACLIDRSQSTQCSHERRPSRVPVEPELCDPRRDCIRHEPVDRLAAPDPLADLGRGHRRAARARRSRSLGDVASRHGSRVVSRLRAAPARARAPAPSSSGGRRARRRRSGRRDPRSRSPRARRPCTRTAPARPCRGPRTQAAPARAGAPREPTVSL